MVIIDAPVASTVLLEWLESSQHPVLGNDFARNKAQEFKLNLIEEDEAAKLVDSGQRVYSNSENALDWIMSSTSNEKLKETIKIMKDKSLTRDLLSRLSPDFYYKKATRKELDEIDPTSLPLPVVLKPTVGFCSMGVYTIESSQDWQEALSDISKREADWHRRYPTSVVATDNYIIEEFLNGPEYAVDVFFDGDGRSQVLNVLRHDFASSEDTSDRLYVTNASILKEVLQPLRAWLDEANSLIGARDFPAHVEVRITDKGIVPIEYNPLRFAGMGSTDIAYHSVGLRTYEAFLEDSSVDILDLYAKTPDSTYSMSLLNPHPDADLAIPFDYERLEADYDDVLELTRFDVDGCGFYGFLFMRTNPASADQLDRILHDDLLGYQVADWLP